MSDEPYRDLFYHDRLFQADQDLFTSSNMSSVSTGSYGLPGFDGAIINPNPYTSFAEGLKWPMDYGSLSSNAFGVSPSSSEVFSSIEGNPKPLDHRQYHPSMGDLCEDHNKSSSFDLNPVTPRDRSHSTSSSSSKAGAEEDPEKGGKSKGSVDGEGEEEEEEDHDSKKSNKGKKKGEKKQSKEPRFAFMTKSEVDHLEDGYRWRKYGQKAVKNSPYPRSYYRCTTQRCGVKKRVERSFTDPSTVVTTYEGQHNHPLPSALRGNAAAAAAAAAIFPPSSAGGMFPPGFLFQNLPQSFHYNNNSMIGNTASGTTNHGGSSASAESILTRVNYGLDPNRAQNETNSSTKNNYHDDDYGLLQDMVPSMFFKPEP